VSPPTAPAASADAASDRPPGAVYDPAADALARRDYRAVLTHLMKCHGDEVLRFCESMLQDRATAEDVRQATFVDAYQALPGYAGRGNLRSWLFGIARHRCLDAAKTRSRLRWRFRLAADAGEREVDGAGPADEAMAEGQRTAILRSCLRELAAGIRVLVLLRYEEGLPYEEIARMSGERATTIQARVARALPLLRNCVEQRGMAL
jgi:RNA polymerase sigma-70 factor, ECF subfamily